MLTRFAPWGVLALASLALFVCAVMSYGQTGDFLLFLVFAGMGILVGLVANTKRKWITEGAIPSLLSYESTRRIFGPSDNDPQKD